MNAKYPPGALNSDRSYDYDRIVNHYNKYGTLFSNERRTHDSGSTNRKQTITRGPPLKEVLEKIEEKSKNKKKCCHHTSHRAKFPPSALNDVQYIEVRRSCSEYVDDNYIQHVNNLPIHYQAANYDQHHYQSDIQNYESNNYNDMQKHIQLK